MADLLTELGRTNPEHVKLLLGPNPEQVHTTLSQTASAIQAANAAGTPTRLIFYYSGHARAQALNLGPAELPFSELRATLDKLPARFTLVVLDACQSGAISSIKGARTTAAVPTWRWGCA